MKVVLRHLAEQYIKLGHNYKKNAFETKTSCCVVFSPKMVWPKLGGKSKNN